MTEDTYHLVSQQSSFHVAHSEYNSLKWSSQHQDILERLNVNFVILTQMYVDVYTYI